MRDHKSYLLTSASTAAENSISTNDAVHFYTDLFDFQLKEYEKASLLNVGDIVVLSEDPPLIKDFQFDLQTETWQAICRGLVTITDLIGSHHSGMEFRYLIDDINANGSCIRELAACLVRRNFDGLEKASIKYNIGTEELVFLLVNWLKPYIISVAEKIQHRVDQEQWYSNTCPVCGYFPDFSQIEESKNGQRSLHCGLCESMWIFKRTDCTICGNADTEKLGYFVHDEKSPYRVEFCDVCRGYIKSIRLNKFDPPDKYDLTVENLLTAHLDSSVIKMGYLRQ